MQLTSFLSTAAGLAVTTNAFLLPPKISESDNDVVNALPVSSDAEAFTLPASATTQSLELNCPGCDVSHLGRPYGTKSPSSHLKLDFTVERAGDHDRLMLNDYELYPHTESFSGAILSAELKSEMTRHDNIPKPAIGLPTQAQPLGFGLRSSERGSPDDGLELVTMDLQVIEVGDNFIDGIPNVQIRLLKTPGGDLLIRDIEAPDVETPDKDKIPEHKEEQCTTLLCKWHTRIMEKLSHMRPHCAGHRGAHKHTRPHTHHHSAGKYPGTKETPPHLLDENTHSWSQLFRSIGSHILLPIAIGIMAGVTASIFGMMIGTVIVFLWRKVVRRGSKGSSRRRRGHSFKAAPRERAVGDEKAGLMANQEEPPAYMEEGLVNIEDQKHETEV